MLNIGSGAVSLAFMGLRMRRIVVSVGVSAALLGLGAGVAATLSDALGLRTEQVTIPVESPEAAPARAAVNPPVFTTIDAPSDLRVDTAVSELRDAVDAAAATQGTATLRVRYGDGDAGDESYALEGTATSLRIVASSRSGAVRGVYDLAAKVRDSRSVADDLGRTVESALPFRMVDLGAVGVTPDAEAWAAGGDYSHNSRAFADVILAEAPYVDEAALESARKDFELYVRHTLAEGYNAIAVPGFLEYLSLEGEGVYDEGDTHPARALAMREAFGPMWEYAHDLGMKVYFRTDMLALSTPLEEYFAAKGLEPESAEFWEVYQHGLDELYAEMPYIDGVLVRIGEAGRVYDLPGWDYYSELGVTTVDAVRAMLTAFTAQAESAGREVIFRSWSVGVGAVGDMHTNQESYRAVLDGIDSPALIVSTKYTLGDFYSHLPLNDTLEIGEQRRIVEFQSRREFENFGALPNDLGDLYQTAIKHFIDTNPRVEGIWTWTQDGGPWRAGPMTLELKTGFWQLYELNTELAVRLARDPSVEPGEITADWVHRWFSDDPATVRAITESMALSRTVVSDGLYVGPYADQRVFALGLEPPPMMWIFEWDILTGDSAVLDILYEVSKHDLDGAIASGDAAAAAAARMQELVASTDASTWKSPELRDHFTDTLDYQVNLLDTLAAYRVMILAHGEWLDTGSADAYALWEAGKSDFENSAAAHVKAYEGNVDLPAYNLTAANIGVDRAERDVAMAWAARGLLALLVVWLFLGLLPRGLRAARSTLVASTRPWRSTEVVDGLRARDKVLLIAVPVVALVVSRGIQTWFEAPAHVGFSLVSWALFAGALAFALRNRNPWPVIAAVGGAIVLRVVVLLVALANRGPGGYWFEFWTDPGARTVYVTIAFALYLWVVVVAGWALAAQLGARRAAAVAIASSGLVVLLVGAAIALIGLETALTIWNDQLALLPWGLSRILGLTVYLEIPADTAWFAAAFGGVLLVAGLLLGLSRRRSQR